MRFLRHEDVTSALGVADAVEVMRDTLAARARGDLVSPHRSGFRVGRAGLVWTPGGCQDSGILGLRLYLTGVGSPDQVTLVWNAEGELDGMAVGPALGRLRTAALGGVAMDALAARDAATLGVVGFGAQGWAQAEAAMAVRPIRRAVVYRRTAERLREDAARASREWGIPVEAAPDAKTVAGEADILVLATTAAKPVVRAEWIRPGTHVNSLGPKQRARSEIGGDLVARAEILVSDVPEQYRAEEEFLLSGLPRIDALGDLAAVVAKPPVRPRDAVSLFLSHGLPGTEVALLAAALRRARTAGLGAELVLS